MSAERSFLLSLPAAAAVSAKAKADSQGDKIRALEGRLSRQVIERQRKIFEAQDP